MYVPTLGGFSPGAHGAHTPAMHPPASPFAQRQRPSEQLPEAALLRLLTSTRRGWRTRGHAAARRWAAVREANWYSAGLQRPVGPAGAVAGGAGGGRDARRRWRR